METAESRRFSEYIKRTSRPVAWAAREALLSALTGQTERTAAGLAATVQGNSTLRAWIGQAIKDGEIVADERGFLRLPEPSREREPETPQELWARIGGGTLSRLWLLAGACPEGSKERELFGNAWQEVDEARERLFGEYVEPQED